MRFYSMLKSPRDSPRKPFKFPSLLSWGFLTALLALDFFQNHLSPTHPMHPSAPRAPLMCGAGLGVHRAGCPRRALSSAPRPPGSGRPSSLSPGRPSALPTWCLGAQAGPQAPLLSPPPPPVSILPEARAPCPLGGFVLNEYVHISSLSRSLKEFVLQGRLVERMASVSTPDTRASPHSPAFRPLPGAGRERAG